MISLPPVFHSPGFRLLWLGVTLSWIGARATSAANLWQMQVMTDSTLAVGLVSLVDAVTFTLLAPVGGSIADRVDRRRLVQIAQSAALGTSALLAVLWFTGVISPLWIYAAGFIVGTAGVFEVPARTALVPGVVPRDRIVEAFSLLVPSQSFAQLAGPALAGVLIAVWGAGAVYLFDVATYTILIVSVAFIVIERAPEAVAQPIWQSVVEGFAYVRGKRILWQLMMLDLVAVMFTGYRTLLPALARDVFLVGPTGYGLLSAAPAFGAIFGGGTMYRLRAFGRKGLLVLGATMLYALCVFALGYAPMFPLALALAVGIGYFDAIGTTVRHALVQMETPDRLRGRVTSVYQMNARGGFAFGQAATGAVAAAIGIPMALAVGGVVTIAYAASLTATGSTVREYRQS